MYLWNLRDLRETPFFSKTFSLVPRFSVTHSLSTNYTNSHELGEKRMAGMVKHQPTPGITHRPHPSFYPSDPVDPVIRVPLPYGCNGWNWFYGFSVYRCSRHFFFFWSLFPFFCAFPWPIFCPQITRIHTNYLDPNVIASLALSVPLFLSFILSILSSGFHFHTD